MCAQFLSGPPSAQGALRRSHLVSQLNNSQAATNLIVAPSGCGKTTLASQYASDFERACWLNCMGDEPDLDLVVSGALGLLGVGEIASASIAGSVLHMLPELAAAVASVAPKAEKCLIVIDDAGLGCDGAVLEQIWLLAQALSQANSVVLVTARSIPGEGQSVLRRYGLIDREDLRLSRVEARHLAREVMHLPIGIEEVDETWEETLGHAAFFVVMAQARGQGVAAGGSGHRLSAWIDYLLETQVASVDLDALMFAALLGRGRLPDISDTLGADGVEALRRCADAIPLVRVEMSNSAGLLSRSPFTVHDLLADHLVRGTSFVGVVPSYLVARALSVLTERSDLVRAARVALLADVENAAEFIDRFGFDCLRAGGAETLLPLIESVPISRMMTSPALMLLWAEVLLDRDEYAESLLKARAARVLAEHQGDAAVVAQAVATALVALRLANRWSEAGTLLSEARELATRASSSTARMALYRAAAGSLVLAGSYVEAEKMLAAVCAAGSTGDARDASWAREAQATTALLPALAVGDFGSSVQALANLVAEDAGSVSQRVDTRGNLATCLFEMGRISRAKSLFQNIISIAGPASLSHFLPSWGAVLYCDGDEVRGIEVVSKGVLHSQEEGSHEVTAQARVYEAILLRADGRLSESLTSAECAYETLCAEDVVDFRRLAALEIAASLLALGDPVAARAWVEPVVAAGFGQNEHHEFRAVMILAECDRVDGDVARAVERIASKAEHLRSENSNFQAAMYCRAFPSMLGMIAAAIGPAEIPVHLLRLLPAESSERALRASRDLLSAPDWEALGSRLMGPDQFRVFVERKGSPLCRVRLFGGLEVVVGDRAVREKDWRKRKARMLFAILVLERGRQLSREQLLTHVWPDLPEDRAKNNFYVAWSSMKTALTEGTPGPCPYVDNTGGLCSIVRDAVRSDVDEFEEYLSSARQAEAEGDPAKAIEAYERLASVYRGELLPGDLYDEWFTPIRDRYRLDFVAAMLRAVELLLEKDDPCEAVVYARRALAIDPFREDLYQSLLRCQIAAGQRSAAIETFVACKTQIAEELGLDPSPETVALYQQILCMEKRPRYDDFGLNAGR